MPTNPRYSLRYLFAMLSIWAIALGLARHWYSALETDGQLWGMLTLMVASIAIGGTVLNVRPGRVAALFFLWVFTITWIADKSK